MCGKLFILTLACASFVQVWGTPEKDEKIKNAISEVGKIMYGAYWDTNDFSLYSGFTLSKYEAETERYLKEATEESYNLHNFLKKTASFLKDEAKKSNKPQSVYSCIDKVHDRLREKVENVTLKYRTGIVAAFLQFEEKGGTVYYDSRTLFQGVGYERETYADRIASSKEIRDVESALVYYEKSWKFTIYTTLQKLRDDLYPRIKFYTAQVNYSFQYFRGEMVDIKSSLSEMQECLNIKEAISGKRTFLNLINMQ